ncbi:succinate--hydroxymethylglutarate CoA-transferase [Malassezia cuniculi]|uniref:Kinesin-like protein n=1 Tax=Malassezia cuniculi TaxID=948313 RepID=A0AAF0J690_9BASI|nr:succinate--hydroxymethylglutarate CoA-transferase [Malassezia cuniculi]
MPLATRRERSDAEPIRAYLRVRPKATDSPVAPYLQVLSDTEALVTAPPESRSKPPPVRHTFTRVFPPADNGQEAQRAFFEETTLPLVADLLDGANGLVFTYGVTNSGKTYTVQGSGRPGEAGILPRALSVVFNSTKGLECTRSIRPVGLTGVQPGVSVPISSFIRDAPRSAVAVDEPSIQVDVSYRYSVWLSCAEVYNEKIYDLIGAPGSLLDESFRRPLVLKSEGEGGKYIYGIKEIRAPSLGEALELVRRAQENRRVFGTGVNKHSSRSHCVFTIKVIREQEASGGERKYYISRLSIVDLAGSERIANTGLTGERLKEAGSINKSLMCLGQCLETMRKNQKRQDGRRQSIVPFRHSKLTELFQSFFQGDGRVVMVVNVDPYGTGYEENVGVLRFSAVAKSVGVGGSSGGSGSSAGAAANAPSFTERVSDDETAGSDTAIEATDDSQCESESEDESEDAFVTALLEENERLRRRCERAEHMCTIIEATVRDEMMRYMEESIRQVKELYEAQLRDEMADNDDFVDRKIDLFARMNSVSTSTSHNARSPAVGDTTSSTLDSVDASTSGDISLGDSRATVVINETPPRPQIRLEHRAISISDMTDQFAGLSTGGPKT